MSGGGIEQAIAGTRPQGNAGSHHLEMVLEPLPRYWIELIRTRVRLAEETQGLVAIAIGQSLFPLTKHLHGWGRVIVGSIAAVRVGNRQRADDRLFAAGGDHARGIIVRIIQRLAGTVLRWR